jgi:hypothetical protein
VQGCVSFAQQHGDKGVQIGIRSMKSSGLGIRLMFDSKINKSTKQQQQQQQQQQQRKVSGIT